MTPRSNSEEKAIRVGGSVFLVHPEYSDLISPQSFDPAHWENAAEPVSAGGRGSAWFIQKEREAWVLRHYCRGGWVARLSQRSYIFLGSRRVRSFAEFRLLNRLHRQGLPVPKPIAALYERRGALLYRAAILVSRIPGAVPLADFLGADNPDLWTAAGRLVRRFHDAGVHHADLNCHNILVADGTLYLIDFDKSRTFGAGELSVRLKETNLRRLKRSLAKQADILGIDAGLEEKWSALMSGYDERGPNPVDYQREGEINE